MPVVYPVIERIAQELYTRLSVLAEDTSTAETKVSEVIRPKMVEDYTPKHLQIVMKFGSSVIVPELMCPGNPPAIAREQTINLHLHVMPSELDANPLDELEQQFIADVIDAVTTSQNTWHTFGGLAIDAEWRDQEDIVGDGGPDGITLPIAITYRTDEGNPYNVRA
jgi:hypothetical protein